MQDQFYWPFISWTTGITEPAAAAGCPTVSLGVSATQRGRARL